MLKIKLFILASSSKFKEKAVKTMQCVPLKIISHISENKPITSFQMVAIVKTALYMSGFALFLQF